MGPNMNRGSHEDRTNQTRGRCGLRGPCPFLVRLLSADDEFLDQSPRAIAKTAFKEMRDVKSMRILGSTDTDAGLTRIDIRLDDSNCVGSFDTDDGGMRLIKNSDGAWFKGDEKFWRSRPPPPAG